MGITPEYAEKHLDEPAVLCDKREAGTEITSFDLEDPTIFDDLISSGLVNTEGALTIGQVLGKILNRTLDTFSAIKEEYLDSPKVSNEVPVIINDEPKPAENLDEKSVEKSDERPVKNEESINIVTPVASPSVKCNKLKIHIGEGKGVDIEIPISQNISTK